MSEGHFVLKAAAPLLLRRAVLCPCPSCTSIDHRACWCLWEQEWRPQPHCGAWALSLSLHIANRPRVTSWHLAHWVGSARRPGVYSHAQHPACCCAVAISRFLQRRRHLCCLRWCAQQREGAFVLLTRQQCSFVPPGSQVRLSSWQGQAAQATLPCHARRGQTHACCVNWCTGLVL